MPAYFSLEALSADHGDALLLHYGVGEKIEHILIDGGPPGVYVNVLRPRLEQLNVDGKSKLAHLMVTHLDDDHVNGVLRYLEDLQNGTAPINCESVWFNVFQEAFKKIPEELAEAAAKAQALPGKQNQVVLASLDQGMKLKNISNLLELSLNGDSGKALFAGDSGLDLPLSDILTVTLIGPSEKRVLDLYKKWKKAFEEEATEAGKKAITAEYLDSSVFNLSSLVFVVEMKLPRGKSARILLTGDSRGDEVLQGLMDCQFLQDGGTVHFDIIKVAHHGSDRNYEPEFFSTVTADNYVISANGKYDNPSQSTLEWIGAARGNSEYLVWLATRKEDGIKSYADILNAAQNSMPALTSRLRFPAKGQTSVVVNLGDPIGF